jgi:hypothetical protein
MRLFDGLRKPFRINILKQREMKRERERNVWTNSISYMYRDKRNQIIARRMAVETEQYHACCPWTFKRLSWITRSTVCTWMLTRAWEFSVSNTPKLKTRSRIMLEKNDYITPSEVYIYIYIVHRIWGSTAVIMKSTVFWDITPCIPLQAEGRFGGMYHFHLQGRISWTYTSMKTGTKKRLCLLRASYLFFNTEDGIKHIQCWLNFNGLHCVIIHII